ncbi:MAG: response regulator [Spirochaetes bacterium]|nr:response regulator [Spirochaetota bacterium]MBU0955732.1 response regulator [Spirochaetota bacterium]
MKQQQRFWLSALLLFMAGAAVLWGQARTVRIGYYDNAPKIYRAADGKPAGFHADITEAILERLDLSAEYIFGSWQQGLDRLTEGQIDIMLDVAWSKERAELYRFGEETIFINWGVVYVRPGLRLEAFPELDGLRIAGMDGGIHSESPGGLFGLAEQFGIQFEYLPQPDYLSCFLAVVEGRADAAVVNRLFGLEYEQQYRIERSNVVFNPIALKYAFGNDPAVAELAGLFDRELRALKADTRSIYYLSMATHLPGFSSRRVELPEWVYPVLFGIALVLLASLTFIYFLRREIRRRAVLEAELALARDDAMSANRAKTAFLANMSHEIRTPMNAILGYTQILQADRGLDARQTDFLARIASAGEHLLDLINEILDISKIEAGRTKINRQVFDLRTMLQTVESMIRPHVESKGLQFMVHISEQVPVWLVGDEAKIRQILINLLANAAKFTPQGSIELLMEAADSQAQKTLPQAAEGLFVAFRVRDSGPGMEEAELKRLFRPFEQTRAGLASRQGSGLGLALSRRLAKLMGGDILVDSSPEKGSLFSLVLPLSVSEHFVSLAGQEQDCGDKAVFRPLRLKTPAKVLIVDDQATNRDILANMLQPLGFLLMEASDGQEACQLLETQTFDLMILDLVMPVMNGGQVLRWQRERESERKLAKLPVMVLTASSLEDDRQSILAAGADAYIRKPFKLPELLTACSGFLQFEEACMDEDSSRAASGIAGAKPGGSSVSGAPDERTNKQEKAAQLSSLDPVLLARLRHAALTGDVQELRALEALIATTAPLVATKIHSCVAKFDFSALIQELEDM